MNWLPLEEAVASLGLRSCLIHRNGALVFGHYRDERAAADIADIHSCTKSILSALVCIATDEGRLPEPAAARAVDFFPRLALSPDPRARDITLLHLLTMSAGFAWTEFGGANSFPCMTRSPHWVNYVLGQPLADTPGTRMEYNSGISQLLSAVVAQAAGMPTASYAERKLFGPLGIEAYDWPADPQGVHTGGFGLRLRPLDLLKFGQLYLQMGKWDDRQLIPRMLIERSVRPALPSDSHRRGWYGWHWWSDAVGEGPAALPYYFARGYGGQFVYVVPDAEAVVVLTDEPRKKEKRRPDVFREHIAPLLLP